MRFFAHHGCFAEERTIGNYFIVDFAAETDMTAASESDNLDDALNYQVIYDIRRRWLCRPIFWSMLQAGYSGISAGCSRR